MHNKPHDRLDILYVEDDPQHARLAMLCLKEVSVVRSIHHVHDGTEALDYLFRRGMYTDPSTSPRPAMVLLDLKLPRMGGQEVLCRIRQSEQLRHLPVVILSTSSAERDVVAAYDNQASSYLVKPVHFEAFNRVLASAAEYWLTIDAAGADVPAAL